MKTTTETKPAHRSASFVDIGSSSHSQPRRGSRAWNRSSLTGTSATRRRSSASEITFDANAANLERTSLFCPIPKKGYGFFYSRAYKEHKKKRKEKKKEHSDEGSSVDDEIPLKRDLTRRKRNSFHKKGTSEDGMGASRRNFEPTNVTAYLAARVESEKPKVKVEYNHSAALVGGSVKSHMMDIALIGRDGASVNSSRFILACYSSVLEEVFFKQRECSNYVQDEPKGNTLTVDFCNESALKAAVHHCFTGELPPEFATPSPSEDVARYLAQLDHLAHVYKFGALGEVTYRALRKLINRRAVLACAIFDELSGAGAGVVDSIKRYSLDTMREMPMDTLLAGGVQCFKEDGSHMDIRKGFQPERWLDETTKPTEWMPFGEGGRRCLGERLAMAEMKVFLGTMVRKLDKFDLVNLQGDDAVVWKTNTIMARPQDGTEIRAISADTTPAVEYQI